MEQMQRFGWLDAVHPEDREQVRRIWTEAAGTCSIYESEYRVRRADGEWRHLSVRGVPVHEQGRIQKWVGFCRDVTEIQNYVELLERERDFSNAVIECMPGIFYITDAGDVLLRLSRYAEAVSGYSPEEALGQHSLDFIHPDHREMVLAARKRALETGEFQELEVDIVTKAGKRVPLLANGIRIMIDGSPCLMGLGLDISRLKEAERKLRELNESLEERVKERTRQLGESNKQLEQSNKDLEAFSYTVTHDLRAPLKTVSAFAEILQQDFSGQLQAEGQNFLHRIIETNKRMARLIDDVLRYSRTGHTTINLVSVPTTPLIQHLKTDFDLTLKQIGGELEFAPDLPAVKGDATLLAQIFSNLFQNSINYRRKDVPLKLKVNAGREQNDVVFSVSDNGVGIAPKYHEKVFEAFQRLHNDKQTPGSGLGLATVKKAVETMGGVVWIESEVGQGTTFFIRLKDG
jgi:PAS domain S-box-containing protein